MSALGRRAVACSAWKWMDGMLIGPREAKWPERWRIVWEDDGEAGAVKDNGHKTWGIGDSEPIDLSNWLPDFADAATKGCLLAVGRLAWGAPGAQVSPHIDMASGVVMGWRYYINDIGEGEHTGGIYADEAEALVAMLEAAP